MTERPDDPQDLDPATLALLRLAFDDALDEREWPAFADVVMSRVQDEARAASSVALPAEVTSALRAESSSALDGLDDLASSVMSRVQDEARAASSDGRDELPDAVSAALGAPIREELARRDGQWSAFSESVRRQIRQDAVATARKPLAEQAIDQLREDVHAEVEAVAQRFESSFADRVDQRIATQEPGLWARLVAWFEDQASPARMAFGGFAAAAAAAMVLFVLVPGDQGMQQPAVAALSPGGEVTVNEVSFEGTVTMFEEDGIAVIWLEDAS